MAIVEVNVQSALRPVRVCWRENPGWAIRLAVKVSPWSYELSSLFHGHFSISIDILTKLKTWKQIWPKKINQTWEDEGVGLPPNNDLTMKKYCVSIEWNLMEMHRKLKSTFPWRTPWRTSPSISPPFLRPIRTFDSNSPRIHFHNSLQIENY